MPKFETSDKIIVEGKVIVSRKRGTVESYDEERELYTVTRDGGAVVEVAGDDMKHVKKSG